MRSGSWCSSRLPLRTRRAMGICQLFADGGKTWLPGVNYIGWRAYLIVAMADLVIGCHEGDVALSKQLIGDLPV